LIAAQILAGREPQTQFAPAMEELVVETIRTRSAQANGRVDRMNGTLQDRLLKALRRAQIRDLKQANAFLEQTFLPEFSTQFVVPTETLTDVHQPVGADRDRDCVLSLQQERVVQNDGTVRWQNGFLQLDEYRAAQAIR
jgi:hypothetical protein